MFCLCLSRRFGASYYPCLHLILSSRIDPPLALSRQRARGQMAELRDADLRLSEPEVAGFLQQIMGLHLI
jgi:LuxR family transcriptional regulator, maltose regulon positive regulatory protein